MYDENEKHEILEHNFTPDSLERMNKLGELYRLYGSELVDQLMDNYPGYKDLDTLSDFLKHFS